MSANPSVIKSVQAVRKTLSPLSADRNQSDLYSTIWKLFQKSEKIVGDRESLSAVLALAAEVERCRGKGSQLAVDEFSRCVGSLAYRIKYRLPRSRTTTEFLSLEEEPRELADDTDVLECFELLAAHTFARTQGPPVRSLRAGSLRATAWDTLGNITAILPHPEHLGHALKVAADQRASLSERNAAVSFLPEYWGGDEPDTATADLLDELMKHPPDRHFLVTVMQARIELGIDNEFGALDAVDDWDDAHEEE